MKAMIIALSVLFSVSAFAKTYDFSNVTPAQIDKTATFQLDTRDQIVFNSAKFGLFNVPSWDKSLCTDGEFIYAGKRTLKQSCTGSDNDNNCKDVTVYLIQPVSGKRKQVVCVGSDDDDNCDVKIVDFNQSPNRQIPVLLQQSDKEINKKTVAGYKAYSIPACPSMPPVVAY